MDEFEGKCIERKVLKLHSNEIAQNSDDNLLLVTNQVHDIDVMTTNQRYSMDVVMTYHQPNPENMDTIMDYVHVYAKNCTLSRKY